MNTDSYSSATLGVLIGFLGLSFYNSAIAVLARILAEHRLLDSTLGVLCLSSAAIELVVAWILLAIVLAFNSTSANSRINFLCLFVTLDQLAYLDPLWVILLAVGHVFIFYFTVRRGMGYLCDRVKESETLTPLQFVLFLLMVFGMSWFTDQMGISVMFGAFEAGVLVPRKGPAVRLLKEKLEGIT